MKGSNIVINIARQFSKYPGPRFSRLGHFSGEQFRDDVLVPALRKNEKVTIQLDGTKGYGSSFLEEAFGGAVRAGCEINENNLELLSEDSELLAEIWEYIKDAQKMQRQ